MQLDTLEKAMLDFAANPCKSWGDTRGGEQFMDGCQASVIVGQSDRNTARLLSGTYTQAQHDDFDRQLAQVESGGHGTPYFSSLVPDVLEYQPTCVDCGKPFASCLNDADTCYDCCLKRLCPPLPGRQVSHWWKHDDGLWTLQVHGDVGFHNELHYWWSNHNTGSNVGHQGLIAYRTPEGAIKKLVFTTASQNANRRYRIVWDLEARTTKFFTATRASVVDDTYTPKETELNDLDPFVLDFIVAMTPAFMLYKHRPRNPANGCFA